MSIRFPSYASDNSRIPFVHFSFFDTASKEQARSTLPQVVLFMPPAFQITDGQEYEFAEQGGFSKAVELGANLDSTQGWSNLYQYGKSFIFGQSETSQDLAKLGRASRDPKFFNYKEPRPREFTFTYKFEPRNEADAKAMMAAISTLRTASYPEALAGGRQYKVPDSVKITFKNIRTSLDGVKEGSTAILPTYFVIKEVNTTISEGDQVVTFMNGYPTQVSLQIQFAETVLLTRNGDSLAGDGYSNASPIQNP